MIVLYIFAAIGAFTVVGVLLLILMIATSETRDETDASIEVKLTCGLTGERCIFTEGRGTCEGCPVLEEAEKIGDR